MNAAHSFSADYHEARTKFLEAASQAGAAIEHYAYPVPGPDGRPLHTDIAYVGSPTAPARLALLAGTHGVEGFCGSGAQVDFLRRGETKRLPDSVGLLLVHAVNPYGFAWLRRVTHENVDLNRNWVDFDGEIPNNPWYDALREAICPTEWTDASRATAGEILAGFAAREGADRLNFAMSGGQYSDATGIFYGGDAPAFSRVTQETIFRRYLASAAAVGIIDYHTGLGPWGFGEQISTSARDTPEFRRAKTWYGAALKSTVDGSAAAVRIVGDGMSGARTLLQQSHVTAIALEFGTIPPDQTRLSLRADAWLHAYGVPLSDEGDRIRQQIRSAYYGDTDDWKGMVAGQSLLACRQAIAGLAAAAGGAR